MERIFQFVDGLFAGVVPVADFLWDFPTNLEFYRNIPILGQFSLAFILLLGAGVYFTLRLGFVQVRFFRQGVKLLVTRKQAEIGTKPITAFLLSTASRVGAGNIVGVTGAITIGGPGAVFWMWVSAFFGMSLAFAEATLAQVFKERKGNEYVGGLTFYVQKIWGNFKFVGFVMCLAYLTYNMLSIPVHTFHVFTASSSIIDTITGRTSSISDPIYYIIAIAIIVAIIAMIFSGIHKVTRVTDRIVPVMALAYSALVIAMIVMNFHILPEFFGSVVAGAFKPLSIFGGAFGVAMAQGIKRGLMSNEAGMGTVTQAAAISDANHPCEQGLLQGLGVFLDTMVICTCTGFLVTAGQLWAIDSANWGEIKANKIQVFLQSIRELVPGEGMDAAVVVFAAACFWLFAFTTLLSDLIFAEVAANKISRSKAFINFVRGLGAVFFVPLGTLTVLAGLQLDNLWYVSDLINVLLVLINIPTLLVARKYIIAAYKDYVARKGGRFVAEDIGIESDVWTRTASQRAARGERYAD